jgi:hypothetical protein
VDTLVFLYAPNQTSRPTASFYVNSQVLLDSGSTQFLGHLEDRANTSNTNQLSRLNTGHDDDRAPPDTVSENGTDIRDTPSATEPLTDYNVDLVDYYRDHPEQRRFQPSSNIKYDLFVHCPESGRNEDPSSWVVTTRNFFAMLHDHDSLAGTSLFEAISKVTERLFGSSGYLSESIDKRHFMIDFLKRHKFNDVRNSFSRAASMLAFSELPQIQWKEGYVEFYAHCAGMRHAGMAQSPEWHHITPCTQILLHTAASDLTRRFRRAQKLFFDFELDEMWPLHINTRSGGRTAYERFRTWLSAYILDRDPSLRHAMVSGRMWLTPERLRLFKAIFHSLFDYLVDRDVIFNAPASRDSEPWTIISRSGRTFRPDPSHELPITEMLNDFDATNAFPHIPHPYPLVPPSIPSHKPKTLYRRFASVADELQIEAKAASYTDASNLYTLSRR